MPDTQWPLWEVFKQDKPDKAHESVGTVHAPDAEMALLNARDVYVRRPRAVSVWVCPHTAVYAKTAEELAAHPLLIEEDGPTQTYHVFIKTSQRRAMTFVHHVGAVTAVSPESALQQAIDSGQFGSDVWVWWIIPDAAITRTAPGDAASLFDPALDKTYRQQTYYGFVSPSRKKRNNG
ncbi:MAG: phenylacetic acid degradation protein [Anaerolineae bacterium]